MKLVRWSFNNLHVPMVKDDDGKLWCTNKSLADALGTTESTIRSVAKRNKDKLKSLSMSICNAKDFILDHKVELGIARVRQDIVL